MRYQITIDFDRVQACNPRRERTRQDAMTWADFNDMIDQLRREGVDHALYDICIVEKVLAEAPARDRDVHGLASMSAKSTAARRLAGSASPVPASSSAVPWSTDVRTNGRPRVMLTARPKPRAFNTGRP